MSLTVRRVVLAGAVSREGDLGTRADGDAAARDADARGAAAAEDFARHGLELRDVVGRALSRDAEQRAGAGRVQRQAGASRDAGEVLDAFERVVGADVADADDVGRGSDAPIPMSAGCMR